MSKLDDLIKKYCPDGVEYKGLVEICNISTGKLNANAMCKNGIYPFFTCNAEPYKINTYAFDTEAILISGNGSKVGHINYYNGKFNAYQRTYVLHNFKEINPIFILYYLDEKLKKYIKEFAKKGSVPYITLPMLQNFLIPLPPIQVQAEIVRILDKLTNLTAELEAELESRKKQYEYYRIKLLDYSENRKYDNSKIEWIELGQILDYVQPTKYIVNTTNYNNDYSIPVLTAGQTFILGYTDENHGIYNAKIADPVIIFDDFTTSFHWVDFKFKVKSSAMKILKIKKDLNVNFKFIYYAMKCIKSKPTEHSRQWISNYSKIKIPVPSIKDQIRIARILDEFDKLINNITSNGLPAEIEKRKQQYEYYRNKLFMFEEVIK